MLESWKIELKVSNGKKWWRKRGATAIFIFHLIYYFFLVQNHTSIIKRKTKTKKPHQSHRELKRGKELSLPDNLLWGKVFQGRLWVGVTHVKYTDSSDLPEGERDGQSLLGKHLHHAAHGHFPFLELVRTWQENEPDSGKRKWAKKEAETLANQSPGEVEASGLGLSRLSGPEWSYRPRSPCHVVKNARAMWWTSLSERPRKNNCVGKGDSDTGHRAKPREKNCSKDIATTLGFLRTPKPTASFNLGNDWRPLPDLFPPPPFPDQVPFHHHTYEWKTQEGLGGIWANHGGLQGLANPELLIWMFQNLEGQENSSDVWGKACHLSKTTAFKSAR